MIARKNPGRWPEGSSTWAQTAALYGLTERELRSAYADFLQKDGYDDCRNKYTIHEWLTKELIFRR